TYLLYAARSRRTARSFASTFKRQIPLAGAWVLGIVIPLDLFSRKLNLLNLVVEVVVQGPARQMKSMRRPGTTNFIGRSSFLMTDHSFRMLPDSNSVLRGGRMSDESKREKRSNHENSFAQLGMGSVDHFRPV
ncbi:hypothetical protein CEXT_502511, partial [Caerostris extrusa]